VGVFRTMRSVIIGVAVVLAVLDVGCATFRNHAVAWQRFTAPHDVTFLAPPDLKLDPAEPREGLLARYRAEGYYLEISWSGYPPPATRAQRAAWALASKPEIEVRKGYKPPWPIGASLHSKWLRPGVSWRSVGSSKETPAKNDYRILYVFAGCKTRNDLAVATKILRSVQFTPW